MIIKRISNTGDKCTKKTLKTMVSAIVYLIFYSDHCHILPSDFHKPVCFEFFKVLEIFLYNIVCLFHEHFVKISSLLSPSNINKCDICLKCTKIIYIKKREEYEKNFNINDISSLSFRYLEYVL